MINIKVMGNIVQGEAEGQLKDMKRDTLIALYAIQQMIKDAAGSEEEAEEAVRHWKKAVALFVIKNEEPVIVKVFESDKADQAGKIRELFDGSWSDFLNSASK
jgi:hypothetical protein